MINFSRNDINRELGAVTYQRGLGYFNQHRVEDLIVDKTTTDSVTFHTQVQGRGVLPYGQEITIKQLTPSIISIEGYCDCPMEYNCKHVAAGCLQYLQEPVVVSPARANELATENSLSWLNKFVSSTAEPPIPDTYGTEFIIYIFNPVDNSSDLSVSLLTNRYLKKGGLGKGRRIELNEITFRYSNPELVQDNDKEIAELIEVQNQSAWGRNSRYKLRGEVGFLAIKKILASGRCYWRDCRTEPLHFAEPRQLHFNWLEENEGNRRLQLHLEPEARLLNTSPALYLDSQTATMGLVAGADFTPQQWSMLLESPLVPAAASLEFSQQLVRQLPATPLPPPQQMETKTIAGQIPVPRLFLFAEADAKTGELQHFIRLRFTYADYEITVLPQLERQNIIADNKLIIIRRNLNEETPVIELFRQLGFSLRVNEQQGDIYFDSTAADSPMESVERWQHFLDDIVPALEKEGWSVVFDDEFQLQFLQADNWAAAIEADNETSDNNWFDLRFDLEVQGRKLPLLPLIVELLNDYELDNLPETLILPIGNNQYLQLPAERIRPICQVLYELYDSGAMTNTLDSEGSLRLSRFDSARLADLEEKCSNEIHWSGGKAMRALGRKLKNFKGIRTVAVPRGLKAELRDYQQQGLNWLQFLRSYHFNGILADDMGLGKTIQTLAHLLLEKERKRMHKPCLVIAPTSLMGNWRREAEQFTPRLKVLILQGPQRKQYFDCINQYDLILTTYPLLVRDYETLLAEHYYYLILDEAQVIKNPRAKVARFAREVNAEYRLCLTGTPMENHLGELWALFDFLMPGFLGDSKFFSRQFRQPIEKQADTDRHNRLVERISPFMLRRNKVDVVKELPEKTEIIRSVVLDAKQAALYESIRLSMEKKVRKIIAQKGLARSHITILDALLKLRQTCCDPQLLSLPQAKKVKTSAKLDMLMEMLPEMLEEGRRILIFSQFTKMLAIIEKRLIEADISYVKLTGQTTKRDQVIEHFRQGDVDVFLISLKAGGVGLNLTEADTVIHYDPWWNPAVENQATDRTHRIGQKKAVFVYKLITENTLEEKIIAMQARKQALADGVYNKGKQRKDLKLNAKDLQALFAPLGE